MRRMRWIAAASLSVAVCVGSFAAGAAALAAPAVDDGPALVYDARSHGFSYRGVEDGNLFPDFVDLMPGDTATQEFSVQVIGAKEPVTLYVRACYDAAEVAGIEDVGVSVALDGEEAASGTVGDAHGMDDAVEMARLGDGEMLRTAVTIEVPTSLPSDTAFDARGLSWTFVAQEEEVAGPSSDAGDASGQGGRTYEVRSDAIAKTGDGSARIAAAAFACSLAALGAAAASIRRARRPSVSAGRPL